MSIGLLFWILMLLWLVLGILPTVNWTGGWRSYTGSLLEFILFGLVGWKLFGAPIQG